MTFKHKLFICDSCGTRRKVKVAFTFPDNLDLLFKQEIIQNFNWVSDPPYFYCPVCARESSFGLSA